MNGRLFAKRFVAVAVALFGVACLGGGGAAWMKAAVLAACLLAAALLSRRTARDDEWMRRYRGGELPGQEARRALGGAAEGRQGGPPDPDRGARRALVGATALHVLAAPLLMLRDLLRMQK